MKRVAITAVDPGLVARVADSARAEFEGAAPQLADAWRIDNPYSTVWCLEMHAGGRSRRYFVKASKRPRADPSSMRLALQREYEMLVRLRDDGLPDGRAAVVTPLAFYADIPALATVAADGTTLRRVYARDARRWSPPAAGRRLCGLVGTAGEWLASFQDRTAVGSAPFSVDELVDYLGVRLERLARRALPRGVPDTAAIVAGARRRAEALGAGGVPHAARHNDFASHNVVATDDALRVLDFQACDTGPCVFDACNFWLELEWLKLDPSYSVQLLAKMQREFIAGYGRIDPDDATFELARLRYTVNRLLNEVDARGRWSAWSWRRQRTVGATTAWLRRFGAVAVP